MIVDTSALVAFYVPERLSQFVEGELEKVRDGREKCRVLDLVFYEFPNAVRKRVVRGTLKEDEGREIVEAGLSFVELCEVVSGRELAREAYELGLKYSLSVYYASLIALAMRLNDVVLTADEKLLRAVKGIQEVSKYFMFPEGV